MAKKALKIALSVFIIGLIFLFSFILNSKSSFTKINEPINEEYDGKKEVLLGYYTLRNNALLSDAKFGNNHREYDVFKIYDQGIIESFANPCNKQYIDSVSKGMKKKQSPKVKTTVYANLNFSYPNGSLPAIKSVFNLNAKGAKTIIDKVAVYPPDDDSPYNLRAFYYYHANHMHQIKIIKEHCSNCDGIISSDTFYSKIGEPVVKIVSELTN